MTAVLVTGTDTHVGKTITSAWLCHHWQAHYWKPIQSGLEGPTDSTVVDSLILFMGLAVLLIVLAVMLPIIEVNQLVA